MTNCPCCGTGVVAEPLYGCCLACATDAKCQRCVSCGKWHHDHAASRGLVTLGADFLPRCAPVCGLPVTSIARVSTSAP